MFVQAFKTTIGILLLCNMISIGSYVAVHAKVIMSNQYEEVAKRLMAAVTEYCVSFCTYEPGLICSSKIADPVDRDASVHKESTISTASMHDDSVKRYFTNPDGTAAYSATKFIKLVIELLTEALDHSSKYYPVTTDAVTAYILSRTLLKIIVKPVKCLVTNVTSKIKASRIMHP